MQEYKRTASIGTAMSNEEMLALEKVLEDAGDFLVVAPPPDFAAIRKKFVSSLKSEYKEAAVLFACQMACQGFKGNDYYDTVKIHYNGKEVSLGEATENKNIIQKRTKGTEVVNPRRVCVAFSRIIRTYVGRRKVVTASMKRYNSNEDFLFIGGHGAIKDKSEANRMVKLVFSKDGSEAADKLVKYFQAVGVGADPMGY